MKTLPFRFLIALLFSLAVSHADEVTSLPFPVSLGGQSATYKAGEPFAKIEKAVKNDAALEVTAKGDMIIINVNKVDDKGQPTTGAQPAIILLQGTTKGSLAGTMDKQKLAAGRYLLSVVAEGKTASILFTIE